MRLIIAEKPSLGRAIAEALPGGASRQDGAIRVGDTIVTWCVGHLLEQAAPEVYDARFKQWRLDHLPILPAPWKLTPRSKTKSQLAVIRRLLKEASLVVHAGDPDREGQLLVQEVLEQLRWKGPVQRLLINDMNRPAVVKALSDLKDNQVYQPLYRAAQARARADWLYGINLTRAWTLTGRQAGHDGVLSVGRVQTPVLGLVARRDQEIAAFEPKPFYVLWADLAVKNGRLRAWWQPGETLRLDDQGRLLERAPAQALAEQLPGAQGLLAKLDAQHKRQGAPLPYSLSALQVDAARRYKLSAKQVLDTCQALYERHKLITYPRSDCRYLPKAHHAEAPKVLESACRNDSTLQEWYQGADFNLRSRAWNDDQVSAHHALSPTGKATDLSRLSSAEANIFRLITRNLLAQFYPALETREIKAEFVILEERFRAQGREILVPGWKPLFTTRDEPPALPALTQGETCQVLDQAVEDRETRPPEPFTDASLIKAMMNIARYVENPEVRRTLRDTDGLGTEATRAGILDTLESRGYLIRQQGSLRATRLGHALIAALPEAVTRPERTALWEQRLRDIAEQDGAPEPFLKGLIEDLQALLKQTDAGQLRQALASAQGIDPPAGKPATKGYKRRSPKRKSAPRTTSTPTRKAR